MDKRIFKMSKEKLEIYNELLKKHNIVRARKGKGSYSRKRKHRKGEDND